MRIQNFESPSHLAEHTERSKYVSLLMAFVAAASLELSAAEPGFGLAHSASTASVSTVTAARTQRILESNVSDIQPINIPSNPSTTLTPRMIFPEGFLQKKGFQARLEQFARTRCIDLGQIGEGRKGFHIKAGYITDRK